MMTAKALLAGAPEWTQSLVYPGDELGTAFHPWRATAGLLVNDISAPPLPPPAVGSPVIPAASVAAADVAASVPAIETKPPRDYGAVIFVIAAAAGVFLLFRALR